MIRITINVFTIIFTIMFDWDFKSMCFSYFSHFNSLTRIETLTFYYDFYFYQIDLYLL